MNTTLRKETPDSDAVASSEDERPWPTAPSFGTLPRKENGVPGLGGGIWSTHKRGSFNMEKTAQRNAARDARLGAVHQPRSILRADSTPSPSASDGSGALPFAIPLHPTPKAGRSLSHSQGQREFHASVARSGSNEQGLVLPLGLLAEEVDTETDSELGGALTHTTSHPPIGTLQRTSTYPPTFESFYGAGNSRDVGSASSGAQADNRNDRKFESAFANLSVDPSQRRSQWQTHLGWDDVPNVNESRRHSLADIPTRRGSLVGADGRPALGGGPYWSNGLVYNWEEDSNPTSDPSYRDSSQTIDYGVTGADLSDSNDTPSRSEQHNQLKYNDKDDQGRTLEIPSMYKVPYIRIAEHERPEQDKRAPAPMSNAGQWGGTPNRPRKQLYIVSFKCSRVDVFYLLDNTGLFIKEGDIVIVEADRGQDLGTVQHANVTPDDARLYKRKYGEEQYKWLMMFSKNNQHGNVNPNAQLYGENSSGGSGGGGGGGGGRNNLIANAPATMQGLPRDNFNNLKPKAIKRLANGHEIRMLSEKEGNEAKAKRACQQKVAHLHLDMEILDAEWQWDFQKLIFYYYADHYINFKDLITELYRIYKTRIWLSAINPASFSQHALGQPPSGIGPGAVGGFNPQLNNTYTMMYGADPDPYGAIPPYRIGYETYTPNYPGIPGVANSFAPGAPPVGAGVPPYGNSGGDTTPSMPPGVTPTGPPTDYSSYYDRGGNDEQTPRAFVPPNPFAGSVTPTEYYHHSMYGAPPPAGGIPAGNTERGGAFGYGYQPFSASPGVSGITQGLGRQSNLPAPIGTRPLSNGSTAAQSGPSNNMPTAPDIQRRFPGRIAPDFVPGHHQPPPQHLPLHPLQAMMQPPPPFLPGGARGNLAQTPSDSPHRGGGGQRARPAVEEAMRSYLGNLQVNDSGPHAGENARTDEMARER